MVEFCILEFCGKCTSSIPSNCSFCTIETSTYVLWSAILSLKNFLESPNQSHLSRSTPRPCFILQAHSALVTQPESERFRMHPTLSSEHLKSKNYFVSFRYFSSIIGALLLLNMWLSNLISYWKKAESRIWTCFLYLTFYSNIQKTFTHIHIPFYGASLLPSTGRSGSRSSSPHSRIIEPGDLISFFVDHYKLFLRFKVLLALGVTTYALYLKKAKQNKQSL